MLSANHRVTEVGLQRPDRIQPRDTWKRQEQRDESKIRGGRSGGGRGEWAEPRGHAGREARRYDAVTMDTCHRTPAQTHRPHDAYREREGEL